MQNDKLHEYANQVAQSLRSATRLGATGLNELVDR